jgi:hypothetical protein
MNSDLYRTAWLLAGQWRGEYDETPYLLTGTAPLRLPAAKPAVYIVSNSANEITYVGSSTSGALGRISAHLREPAKAQHWRAVWVIRLLSHTPQPAVRRIEGRIGDRLKPLGSRRLPRAWGP